jgi:hypothetical protein
MISAYLGEEAPKIVLPVILTISHWKKGSKVRKSRKEKRATSQESHQRMRVSSSRRQLSEEWR